MPPGGRRAGAAAPRAGSRIIGPHQIATLFGQVTVRLPRFRCAGCGATEAGVEWPPHCRSTPELDRLRAQLSALMPYRVAAGVLGQMLPVDAGTDPETLRRHTFKIAEDLRDAAPAEPATAAAAITVTLGFDLHPQLRGRRAASGGPDRQCRDSGRSPAGFRRRREDRHRDRGADPAQPRRRRPAPTRPTLTAFTDGCPGLRSSWSMPASPRRRSRLVPHRHAAAACRKDAGSLPADTPEREHAKAVIVAEVDRLHWRIWNGKAKDAQITLERIRARHAGLPGRAGGRKRDPSSRRLWTALREIDRYLTSQSAWLVNYAERHRAGLRVGTSLTEGTANFLVNRRMNKSQQMRWSRRGADLLLQVRCAVFNGKLGSGFGQLFHAKPIPPPKWPWLPDPQSRGSPLLNVSNPASTRSPSRCKPCYRTHQRASVQQGRSTTTLGFISFI